MKRIACFLTLLLLVVPAAFAGTNYDCQAPVTVTLDGNLSDWNGVEFVLVPHDKGTSAAADDNDASFEFAVVADADWLYVAIDIKDDVIMTGESDDWQDDSMEIYIDANHARAETYESDDAQITVGAASIGADIDTPVLTGTSGVEAIGVKVAMVQTGSGWLLEAAIPLVCDKWNITPSAGTVIGFNVHFNDDDDGGGRDHKLIWSDLDTDDQSYNNPTRFADLTFIDVSTAVELSNKLTTTWGSIK